MTEKSIILAAGIGIGMAGTDFLPVLAVLAVLLGAISLHRLLQKPPVRDMYGPPLAEPETTKPPPATTTRPRSAPRTRPAPKPQYRAADDPQHTPRRYDRPGPTWGPNAERTNHAAPPADWNDELIYVDLE